MAFNDIESFKFNRDFPYANEIKYRISRLELAIKYTKHTVQLHQNKKKLIALKKKLDNVIYQHNRFDLFDYLVKQMDEALEKELHESLNKKFDKFTSVRDWHCDYLKPILLDETENT